MCTCRYTYGNTHIIYILSAEVFKGLHKFVRLFRKIVWEMAAYIYMDTCKY